MKKILILFIVTALLFSSCSTLDTLINLLPDTNSTETTSSTAQQSDRTAEKTEPAAKAETPAKTEPADKAETGVWNLAVLDTARNVSYMSEIEKDVVLEMNKARSNPKKYAEMYIQPRIKNFNGKLYNNYIMTNEGVSAVNECINFMNSQKSLSPFKPSKGLTQAAKDHASTQSKTNQTGHYGVDGSDPFERMERYGSYKSTAGENINYGATSAREIVVTLLIDDGVQNRGHRKNILNESFGSVGVGYANQHKTFGSECVIDFAGGFIEKN